MGGTRTVYWLFLTLYYLGFGQNALGFFISNLLLFLLIVAAILLLLNKLGFSRVMSVIAACLFSISVPVAENFYTLTKSEPQQLLWAIISLICLCFLSKQNKLVGKILLGLGCLLSILFSLLTKETSIALLPISAIWLLIALIRRLGKTKPPITPYLTYFLACLLAVGVFFALRTAWGTSAISDGTYSNRYSLDVLADIKWKAGMWGMQMLHMFPYIFILSIALLPATLLSKSKKFPSLKFLPESIIWAAAWMVIFIPWEYICQYYILASGFGISVMAVTILPAIIQSIQENRGFKRGLLLSITGLCGITVLMTLPQFYTNAGLQLLIDRVNHNSLDMITSLPESSVVKMNFPWKAEYADEITRYVNDIHHRPDILIDQLQDTQVDGLKSQTGNLLYAPGCSNIPALTIRVGIACGAQGAWNNTVLTILGDNATHQATTGEQFSMVQINFQSLLCPVIGKRAYCINPAPVINMQTINYQWDLYLVK